MNAKSARSPGKIGRNRIAIVAAFVFGAGVVVAFIDARYVVDKDAIVKNHVERITSNLSITFRQDGTVASIESRLLKNESRNGDLVHFHRGPLPCATYSMPEVPSDEELHEIERDLGGAHLLTRARENSALFWKWGDADERRRHGPITDEELLAAWNQQASLRERNAAFFSGEILAKAIRAHLKILEDAERARADKDEAALSHHEIESLQGVWIRHPIAMSFPTFALTMAKLPRD